MEYSALVESLRRLFRTGNLSKQKISSMVKSNTITEDEAKYIIS